MERHVELAHLDLLRRALLSRMLSDGDTQAGWVVLDVHRARAALVGITPESSIAADQPNQLAEIRARPAARRISLEDG